MAWFFDRRVAELRAEVVELRDRLDVERARSAAREAEIREEVRSEMEFARSLVRSAMLKSGMWPPGSAAVTPQAAPAAKQDDRERAPTPVYRPLWQAQQQAIADEIEAEQEMARGTAADAARVQVS